MARQITLTVDDIIESINEQYRHSFTEPKVSVNDNNELVISLPLCTVTLPNFEELDDEMAERYITIDTALGQFSFVQTLRYYPTLHEWENDHDNWSLERD